ncbi:hypothetical protein [Saccharothrix deserti]|uniref:hypothetical protein n=1 Tax=Saccharothrix deserti TaxID=2593674 RepID=UPI00131C7B0A|nr:hypothetical protein [Saccharothrix deserti]
MALLKDPPPRRTDAASYAAELVSGFTDTRPVQVVMALCMAAPIGLEVVRLFAERDGRPPVFLALDGAPCTVEHVADAYRATIERYRAGDRPGRVEFTADRLRSCPDEVVADITAELTELASAKLLGDPRHADVVAPMVAEVVTVSVDWLVHLIAAHNSDFPAWQGETIIVTSNETPFGGTWPRVPQARVVPLDCSADDLIGADAVTALLVEHVGR